MDAGFGAMLGFFLRQADLLILVETVGWVLAACACNLMRAVEEERGLGHQPWRFLEGFCMLTALHLWLALLDWGLGGRPYLDIAMDATRAGAVLFLLAAARSGWVSVASASASRWALAGAALAAVAGAFARPGSAASLLEVAAGGLAAAWLGLVFGRLNAARGALARALVLAFAVLYGAGLALHAGMGRAAWLMADAGRPWVAAASGMASLLSALGLAGGLLLHADGLRRRSAVLAGVDLTPMPLMAGALLAGLLLFAGGAATYHMGQTLDANMRGNLLLRANTAAAAFDGGMLAPLREREQTVPAAAREKLFRSLDRIRRANPDSRFVYLLGRRGNEVFFYGDSEPESSEEHSALGQVYAEATPELVKCFDTKESFVEGPVPDRWGTWVSAFALLPSHAGGEEAAVFGMDVRADHWGREIALRRLLPVGGTIFLLVVMCGAGLGLVRARIYDLQIAHSNQRFRAAFENTFQFQGLLTPGGLLIEANQTALDFIGRRLDEVRGRPFWDTPWWSGDEERRARLKSAVAAAAGGQTVRYETTHPAPGGGQVHVDFSVKPVRDARGRVVMLLPEGRDITAIKLVEERLRGTERLLRGVAEASLILLAEREYSRGMQRALAALGRAAEVDRVYIFEDHAHPGDGSPCMSQRFEWTSASASPQIDNPELQNLKYDDVGFRRWMEVFHSRRPIMGLVKDFPEGERKILDPQDILSLLAMPIHIGDACWGFIGFDDCHRERVWSAGEQDILMAMTGTLGAAIQRHRAERAQRESDRKYRDVVEQVKEVIFQTDSAGRWTFLNPAWAEVTRFTVEESLGKMFVDYVHPEDRERNMKQFEPLILRRKDYCRHEVRYLTRDGGSRWMEVYARLLLDEQGATVGTAGTLTDVSERKSAETQMRLLQRAVDASANGIVISDATLRDEPVVYVNPAFERITGYTAAETVGRNCRFLQGAHGEQPGLTELRGALKERRVATVVLRNFRKDGSLFWNEFTVAPLFDKEGKLTHFIGSISDVTGRVLAEEEMRRLNTQLGEARDAALESVRLKSEFLANMSHEIRTPLHGILGMVQLLGSTSLGPEQKEFLVNVQSCSDALLAIVDEILDFSKIEAGKLSIEDEDLDLRALLEQALDPFARAAHGKGLEFALRIAPEAPTYVRGDGLRIRQVLGNLLSNALKFTHKGEVVVDVRLVEMRGNRATLRFEVRDTGIGISQEGMKRLFQVFSQVESSTSRRYGGTGLGLAISRRLAELMGGEMGVESRLGEGSAFWFTLPFERRSHAGEPAAAAEDLRGRRVLVAEPNPTQRLILEELLGAWGARPVGAENAAAALELLRRAAETRKPFEALVLDQRLPDMDGVALARAVRAEAALRGTRVILMGRPGADRAEAKSAGVSACVDKPVRQSQLFEALCDPAGRSSSPRAAPAASGAAPDAGLAGQHPLRILVVEDNALNREVALRLLERLGYDAELAGDGAEALRAIAARAYDVVLMDIHMPEMDGFAATRKIRELRGSAARPRIVALTANALKGDRERCLKAGMDDYLSKPLSMKELAAALERAPARPSKAAAGAPLVSWKQLREVAPDASEPVCEMVRDFLAGVPASIGKVARALEAKDRKLLRQEAHKLRGLASTFGFFALAEELEAMERSVDSARDPAPGAAGRAQALYEMAAAQLRLGRAKLVS
jgi:PAS domain S-box-containing protein